MNISINEKRKLISQLWKKNGTNGSSIFFMATNQVFAIYAKLEEEICTMLSNNMNMKVYYTHMESQANNFIMWSDKEVDDYAFEE